MIKETLTIDKAIEFLNSLLLIDKQAIDNLIESRVQCNDDLLDHPTVQVTAYDGLFGTFPDGPKKGWGPIAVVMESDGTIIEFRRTENK